MTEENTKTEDPPATRKVELFGTEIELGNDQAAKLIEGRDALKSELRALREAKESAAAEQAALAEKAEKEAERAAALEAAKKGEIEDAERILTARYTDQIANLTTQLKQHAITSALAERGDVAPSALADVAALLSPALDYSDGKLVPSAADTGGSGRNSDPAAVIASWLESRPHYLMSKTPAGSGGGSGEAGGPPVTHITRAEYSTNPRKYAEMLAAGQVKLKD